MTITTVRIPDVALPTGADPSWRDEWQDYGDGRAYRLVWSPAMPGWSRPGFQKGDVQDVRVAVTQFSDGTIGTDGDDEPMIHADDAGMSVAETRRFSRALLAAADLAEEWSGLQPDPVEALALARHTLQTAYAATRMLPGNAGDYVRAALDSILDAEAVTR